MTAPPDREDSLPPRAARAVPLLALLFGAVLLVGIAFWWPAPFGDLGAWTRRALAAGALGLAAAFVVYGAAGYPPRPG